MEQHADRTAGTPQNVSPLEVGTLLKDRFRVTGVLGVGGFGITYHAVDEVLELAVAIKEYMPTQIAVRDTDSGAVQPASGSNVTDFETGLRRFLEEARRLATFEDHPNIVRVRTFFEENGTSYLVMNYYEGQTLGDRLRARNGVLPEAEGLRITQKVLDGLRAVHDENVLHRDIDPENLYLTDAGQVVLLDFGTARVVVAERTRSLSVILKRGYAPPEQYQNQTPQGPWTDVYATAATLYRMLTGYKPPEASARVLDDELVAPKTLAPSLSDATQAALQAGLALHPDDRPASADAFADLLPRPSASDEQWAQTLPPSPAPDADTDAVRVSTSHACRLYAEGEPVATVTPDDEQVVPVDEGPCRLHAVRLNPTDEAPPTARTSPGSLAGLPTDASGETTVVWRDAVGGQDREPYVEIDFDGEAAATSHPEPPSSPDAAAARAEPGRAPTLRVRTDVPCRLLVDGTPVDRVDPGSPAAVPVDPGEHRIRAEKLGGTTAWEQAVTVGPGAETEVEVTFAATTQHQERRLRGPLAIVALSLIVLLASGFAWIWLGNQAPNPAPDRLMLADEGVLRPLANDHDPEQAPLHVQSVAPLPDSVGTATVLDSARIRVRLVDGFAGTARTQYTVADADGKTARADVVIRAPFWRRPRAITRSLDRPQTVRTAALGGPDAADVIVASSGPEGGTVRLFRNRRTVAEPFAPAIPVASTAGRGLSVATGPINADGAADVVVASSGRGRLVWHENQADGFGPAQPIDTDLEGITDVRTADLDGDGDADVVAGLRSSRQVVWYENEGDGQFGPPRPIATGIGSVSAFHTAPLGGTGRPDVIVASASGRVVWYENRRTPGTDARFQIRHQLGMGIDDPLEVHAADLTGDGEHDVIVSSAGRNALLWFENRTQETGSPAFEPKRTVARNTEHVEAIVTADLNGNGRQDILGRSSADDTILFCANRPGDHFGRVQPITTSLQNVASLRVADVNRDGHPDVIAASPTQGLVAWYPNYLSPRPGDSIGL